MAETQKLIPSNGFNLALAIPISWIRERKEESDTLRSSHDKLGSAAYEKLKDIIAQITASENEQGISTHNHHAVDFYTILRDHHREDATLDELWNELNSVPEWVDWKQIERGQKFFVRYAVANITSLLFQGFLHGNAIVGVPEGFSRTGGFTIKGLLPPFVETFAWLTKITHSLESIQPGGDGHTDSVRVRLINASFRRRIMKLVATRPTYFNVQQCGPLISDYSSVHTISLFCASPMWDALPRIGITPSQQDQDDYIALFRYIAYLIGVPNERFENREKAKATMETFLWTGAEPDAKLKSLADDFIEWVEVQPPIFLSKAFLIAGFYDLNGARYCELLGYPHPSIYYKFSFKGFCLLLWLTSLAQWVFPPFDRFMVQYFRANLLTFLTRRSGLIGSYNTSSLKFDKGAEKESTLVKGPKSRKPPLESFCFSVFLPYTLISNILCLGIFAALVAFLVKRSGCCGYPKT
ncbi:hypothetical protein EG329_005435 [Mollisiaceae sp. DMI_Dod_QoI]|nr:hypothetical protein EG329_005435 [Helotiales sp. DMI_Dod_QoI]